MNGHICGSNLKRIKVVSIRWLCAITFFICYEHAVHMRFSLLVCSVRPQVHVLISLFLAAHQIKGLSLDFFFLRWQIKSRAAMTEGVCTAQQELLSYFFFPSTSLWSPWITQYLHIPKILMFKNIESFTQHAMWYILPDTHENATHRVSCHG